MGCVYSYPLFSFQGSICFSAAKIILSNLHFLVKYYFSYLIQFCLLFFDSEWYSIKHHFVCQALFYLFFRACFRCLCQRILVYHLRSRLSMFFFSNIRCWPMSILFFRLLSCSDIYLLYTSNRKCQHLFSTFFDIFSFPSKIRKRQPFSIGIKAAFLHRFFYIISALPVHPLQSVLLSDDFPA